MADDQRREHGTAWDHAEVKRVDLDHTSDGKMLLSYQTNGQQTWGDLMLPLPDMPTSTSHRDHFMVMFDADGNALWYQHGNVTDGVFDVQSMVMDDGTVAVVRETARDGRAGAYLDTGVTNSTPGRPLRAFQQGPWPTTTRRWPNIQFTSSASGHRTVPG